MVRTLPLPRSVFPGDWNNFLQRLGSMLGGADMSCVTENDFGAGGPLHGLALELQLWATFRCGGGGGGCGRWWGWGFWGI